MSFNLPAPEYKVCVMCVCAHLDILLQITDSQAVRGCHLCCVLHTPRSIFCVLHVRKDNMNNALTRFYQHDLFMCENLSYYIMFGSLTQWWNNSYILTVCLKDLGFVVIQGFEFLASISEFGFQTQCQKFLLLG